MTDVSRLFDDLKKWYWQGRLPRYRVIRRAKLTGRALGSCNNRTKTILLLASLTRRTLRLTLLHEMCHIGRGASWSHGPVFQRKLRRLIRLGEFGLLDDLEQYDGTADARDVRALSDKGVPYYQFLTAVQDNFQSLSLDSPRFHWKTVRRLLAEEYHVTPTAFQRCAPWAQKEWQRLSKEIRDIAHAEKVAGLVE